MNICAFCIVKHFKFECVNSIQKRDGIVIVSYNDCDWSFWNGHVKLSGPRYGASYVTHQVHQNTRSI